MQRERFLQEMRDLEREHDRNDRRAFMFFALVIVISIAALLAGCSGVPGQIVVSHADLAGTDHLARVEADPDTPEAVKETWRQHWAAIRAAGESAGE